MFSCIFGLVSKHVFSGMSVWCIGPAEVGMGLCYGGGCGRGGVYYVWLIRETVMCGRRSYRNEVEGVRCWLVRRYLDNWCLVLLDVMGGCWMLVVVVTECHGMNERWYAWGWWCHSLFMRLCTSGNVFVMGRTDATHPPPPFL